MQTLNLQSRVLPDTKEDDVPDDHDIEEEAMTKERPSLEFAENFGSSEVANSGAGD